MAKSDQYVDGYTKCLESMETDPRWPNLDNPYPKDSDAWSGWEEAYYDLTQK
jgi:hypothetical protein